jgi:Tfp pilus assembly protein PilN
MANFDYRGQPLQSGEDIGLKQLISGLGGLGSAVDKYAAYKVQEEKKRQKEEEALRKEQQKREGQFKQIKQLKSDLPDEVIWRIIDMDSGPLKQSALSAIKKPDPILVRFNGL